MRVLEKSRMVVEDGLGARRTLHTCECGVQNVGVKMIKSAGRNLYQEKKKRRSRVVEEW